MVIAAWLIFIFTFSQLLVALINLVYRQPTKPAHAKELVSILIPARNEEKNIGALLSSLRTQEFKNIEILVFDDQSEDTTAAIIKKSAQEDDRIRYIASDGLPKGWLGKNYGCHRLSLVASGNYFIFIDADVIVGAHLIDNTLAAVKKNNLGLLSYFPVQKMNTIAEIITVPNMNFILLSLLPLILVEKTRHPSLAAANGQFMFFNAETYRKYRPHEKLKQHHVEDIETARYLKRNNVKVSCRAAGKNLTCRMYTNFTDALDGFSKNITTFFGNSFVLAFLFWFITSFGFIITYLAFSASVFFIHLAALLLIRILISFTSRQPVIVNLLLAIPQQIAMGLFLYKFIINRTKKQFIWKDRNVAFS